MSYRSRISWYKVLIVIPILFGITFFTYKDALKGGMVWDAGSYLIDNPYITALSWENIKWMFSSVFVSNWHPLTWLSYTFDYLIYESFWGVALTNIVLHCLNTILVFLLALAVISLHYHGAILFKDISFKDFVAAFIASLWFGIHPQHVESVAWLAERKDVLCLFFTLLTLIFYLKYASIEKSRKRIFYYLMAFFFFVFSIMSKPMAVTTPVLLIIADIYPLKRVFKDREKKPLLIIDRSSIKILLIEKVPFFLVTLMLVLLTIFAQSNAMASLENHGYQIRVLNAFNSFIVYISKLLFPVNLIPLYTDFPDPLDPLSFIPVIAFILITVVFVYFWAKGQEYWLAAWVFYIVALLPVIGLLQVGVQSSADRYAYLPTVPFYILAGCGIARILFYNNMFIKISSFMIVFTLSVLLFLLTQKQIPIWLNEFTLWNHIIKVMPDHGPANSSLGDYFYNKGQYEKAIGYYEKAGNIGKLVMYSFPAMAIAFLKLNKLDQALQVYANILTKKYTTGIPDSCIYYNVGLIYARKGLLEEARQAFSRVKMDSDPEFLIVSKLLIPHIERLQSGTAVDKDNQSFFTLPLCEKLRVYTAIRVYDKKLKVIDERY